jgi:hypothetical protein
LSSQILPERGPHRRPDRAPIRKTHLERLVVHYAKLTGTAPARVRRWLSVMVLLGALDRVCEADPVFLLKGGVAIEMRLRGRARATKDVDLVFFGDPQDLGDDLDRALAGPYSEFSFQRQEIDAAGGGRFQRLEVKLLYRGRSWSTLRLEVAAPDSQAVDGEPVPAIPLDEFGIDGPKAVPCLSLRYQIAQKLHAVTERVPDHENERFRDLIDLIICRDLVEETAPVKEACLDTFAARVGHDWPPKLIVPAAWAEPYTALATEMDFPIQDVEEAAAQVRGLIAEIDSAD